MLPAWRETGYFSPAERAALAIAEEITHIGMRTSGVDDDTASLSGQQAAALRWVADCHQLPSTGIAISSHYAVEP